MLIIAAVLFVLVEGLVFELMRGGGRPPQLRPAAGHEPAGGGGALLDPCG